MGSWGSITTTAGVAEGAKTAWFLLLPHEGAHIFVERTDGGSTAIWTVQLWTAIDALDAQQPDHPTQEYDVDPADKKMDFALQGPYYSFAVGNKAVAGDAVVISVKTRLNGGLS